MLREMHNASVELLTSSYDNAKNGCISECKEEGGGEEAEEEEEEEAGWMDGRLRPFLSSGSGCEHITPFSSSTWQRSIVPSQVSLRVFKA